MRLGQALQLLDRQSFGVSVSVFVCCPVCGWGKDHLNVKTMVVFVVRSRGSSVLGHGGILRIFH